MIGAALYLAVILLTLWVARRQGWDRDDGGYREPFALASFLQRPQLEHVGLSLLLAALAPFVFRIPWLVVSALESFAAGAGWELIQRFPRVRKWGGRPGYASKVDLTADAVGCLVGSLLAAGVRALTHP